MPLAGGYTSAEMGDRKDIHTTGIPVLCRACEARHRGICGALTPDELVALARHTHKETHAPGAGLIADGGEVDSYANVMSGVVKLSKVLEDGRQQVVGLQFAPDFLGRLYADESAVAAEAASGVELCVMPKAAFERLVAETPHLEHRIMKQTLRELDEARDWMVTLGRKTALERVASLLLLVATHGDPNAADAENARFELPLSRGDIADYLGLTIETVSRQLGKLKRIGVIRLDGARGVDVPDLGALRELCE
jgi:CRP/FNR family transcriptional regulator